MLRSTEFFVCPGGLSDIMLGIHMLVFLTNLQGRAVDLEYHWLHGSNSTVLMVTSFVSGIR